jgi:hypothetical protein
MKAAWIRLGLCGVVVVGDGRSLWVLLPRLTAVSGKCDPQNPDSQRFHWGHRRLVARQHQVTSVRWRLQSGSRGQWHTEQRHWWAWRLGTGPGTALVGRPRMCQDLPMVTRGDDINHQGRISTEAYRIHVECLPFM